MELIEAVRRYCDARVPLDAMIMSCFDGIVVEECSNAAYHGCCSTVARLCSGRGNWEWGLHSCSSRPKISPLLKICAMLVEDVLFSRT
jgi:hypothetical protein